MWTALSLLAAVMLPTRVHERYIVTVMPFAIAAAMCSPIIWVGLAPLSLAAFAQITSYDWLKVVPEWWGLFLKEKDAWYEAFISQQRADGISPLSTMDQFLASSRVFYDRDRARYVAVEWAVVVLALVGSGLTAYLMLRRPRAAQSVRRAPDVARAPRRR
jgi:hypothetical protein